MGVDRTDYLIYGWKLPINFVNSNGPIDIWDEKFRPYMEGHKGIDFSLIFDGMGGKYTVFGKRIAFATDDGDGWGFMELDLSKIGSPGFTKDKFKEIFEIEPPSEPSLFIFSHWH